MEKKWVKKWPTKAGLYWFYGWRFGKAQYGDKEDKPELSFVEIRMAGSGNNRFLIYITRGHFLSMEEKALGLWTEADTPELPDITKLES